MGKRAKTQPVIEDILYGYQPPSRDQLELLLIVHRWSGLPGGRAAVSVTYIGDVAGERKRKNATNSDTSARCTERFGKHIAQFLHRRIVVTEGVALSHYERLSGPHGGCPTCGHIGPIGAIFCGDLRPLGRPDEAPPPLGCGLRFAATPARQTVST